MRVLSAVGIGASKYLTRFLVVFGMLRVFFVCFLCLGSLVALLSALRSVLISALKSLLRSVRRSVLSSVLIRALRSVRRSVLIRALRSVLRSVLRNMVTITLRSVVKSMLTLKNVLGSVLTRVFRVRTSLRTCVLMRVLYDCAAGLG